jgi:SAM-dependent methyltransferase
MADPFVPPAAPQLLTQEEFRTLGGLLVQAGFTQQAVCARLNLHPPLEYEAIRALPPRQDAPRDTLDLLARLFILGTAESGLEVKRFLPQHLAELLEASGLLGRVPTLPGKWAAQAMLYPLHDLWIASDRWSSADGSPYPSFPDIVYPALASNTVQFLNWLPRTPCADFLELCAGTAAMALLAARHYARRAWATDIALRSVHFAEFNRRLNALENVTVKQGDLFEPADPAGQFDRIVAHPPYMPSLKPAEVYYDGGPDGELVTSTALREVSKYLRPAGRFYLQTMGTDRQDLSFEQRIRAWLDSASDDFHLAIIVKRLVQPEQFAMSSAVRDGGGTELANQWRTYFRKRHIIRLIYGLIVLERKPAAGAPYSVNRMAGRETGLDEIEWLMRWEEAASDPRRTRLSMMRPVTTPRAELRITHKKVEGELVPAEALLAIEYPFSLESQVPPWTGYLLALCDGSRTVAQLCEECKQRRCFHEDTSLEEFSRFVANLISGGILEVAEHPLPKSSITNSRPVGAF